MEAFGARIKNGTEAFTVYFTIELNYYLNMLNARIKIFLRFTMMRFILYVLCLCIIPITSAYRGNILRQAP